MDLLKVRMLLIGQLITMNWNRITKIRCYHWLVEWAKTSEELQWKGQKTLTVFESGWLGIDSICWEFEKDIRWFNNWTDGFAEILSHIESVVSNFGRHEEKHLEPNNVTEWKTLGERKGRDHDRGTAIVRRLEWTNCRKRSPETTGMYTTDAARHKNDPVAVW